MTPIQLAAFMFVAERRLDPATGRHRDVDLRDISEPMRQRIIDLGMMEPPLVDVDGDCVFLTGHGYVLRSELLAPPRPDGKQP